MKKPNLYRISGSCSTAFVTLIILGASVLPSNAAVSANPDSGSQVIGAGELLQRGNDLYNRGEFAKAMLLYERASTRGADPVASAFNLGNCLFRLNRFSLAAAEFKKAVRLSDGKFNPAQLNLASVLFRLEQYGEAIAAYRRLLQQDPENLSAWLYLADAYVRTKDYVGALRALEKARRLDPEDISLIYQAAEIHSAMKEYDKAIQMVRQAFARKPSEVDFLFYIGDLYRADGKLGDAAASYREGLALKPDDIDALYKLADVLTQDGKAFLAMDYLQKALNLKPSFSDAAVFLGNLAFDAKWWDRSETAYLTALKSGNKEGAEGLRNLAYELHRLGRNEEAAKVLERTLPLRPQDKDLKTEAEQYRELAKKPIDTKLQR